MKNWTPRDSERRVEGAQASLVLPEAMAVR